MEWNIKPLGSFGYPVTMNYKGVLEKLKYFDLATIDRDKVYIIKGEDNKMKDFIVLHRDDRVAIILKKAITAISKFEDGTQIYFDGNALFVDDKYEDVIKQYLA